MFSILFGLSEVYGVRRILKGLILRNMIVIHHIGINEQLVIL